MRKSILTYGSFLLAVLTIVILLEVKSLWANRGDCNYNLYENQAKVVSEGDIIECIAGTWLGTKSTDWNDPLNWCKNILPTSTLDVRIPEGGNQPIINTSATCKSITINVGAALTITNTSSLTVHGDWINNGIFNENLSTVTFAGTTQNISGNNISPLTFYKLILSASTVKFSVPIEVSNNLTINNGSKCSLISKISSANTLTLGDYGQVSGEWAGNVTYGTLINSTFFVSTSSGKLIVANNSANPGLWLGMSSDWATGSNWSDGVVPSRETDAIITTNGSYPVISGMASCKNLLILPAATLEIKNSNVLSVSQNWNNQGTSKFNFGTVIFDGDNQSIGKESFYNLTMGGNGTKTFNEITVSGVLSMEGTATLSNTLAYLSSATLQYNRTADKTIDKEWPSTKISGVVIKQGKVTLPIGKSLNYSPLTLYEGTKLDVQTYPLSSVGPINLQCGGKVTGSIITGTSTLTLGGDLTVTNSGQGTAAAVIECPISTTIRTFNIEHANSNITDPTDLLINNITTTGILTKTGTGTMSIKGDGTLSSLKISNGNVTIQPGASLNISGSLTNSVGTTGLSLLSDGIGTGSLILNQTATGSATITRSMAAGNHHLITSPLGGQSINSFLTDKTNALTIQSGQGANADYRNMRDYNPSANDWNEFFKVGTNYTTGELTPGKGYSIRIKTSQAHQVVFTGTLPSGDISLAGLESGYWNCIGNPYTSAVIINSAGEVNTGFLGANVTNLDQAFISVYVWDPATNPGQYTTISNATYPYNLQQGQAFMVKMAPLKTVVSFNKFMQVHDVALALKSTENSWSTIQLVATADSINSSTIVAFHEGMTHGLDPSYDAGLLSAEGPIELYTRLVDDYGIPFDIQALPSDEYDKLVIPVGMDYPSGGQVTFSASSTYLPSSCSPVLEDRLLGILSNLSNTTYTTDLEANTTGTGRFYLHTSYASTETDNHNNSDIYSAIFINQSQLRIQGKSIKNVKLTLTDVLGRQIIAQQIKEEEGNIINIPAMKPGAYLLNIKGHNISQTLKMLYVY